MASGSVAGAERAHARERRRWGTRSWGRPGWCLIPACAENTRGGRLEGLRGLQVSLCSPRALWPWLELSPLLFAPSRAAPSPEPTPIRCCLRSGVVVVRWFSFPFDLPVRTAAMANAVPSASPAASQPPLAL